MADTRTTTYSPTGAGPTVGQAYAALIRSRVAAQAAYRTSFAVELGSQILLVLVEFVEVYVVFHQVDSLGGFAAAGPDRHRAGHRGRRPPPVRGLTGRPRTSARTGGRRSFG